jgi:predicted porin
MKKTLIALAAVAVSSAAMAQATVSGNIGFAYESATQAGTASKSGYGLTDSNITFRATEDLGGGVSATAAMAFNNFGRDRATTGRDVTLTVNGGFGTVFAGEVEAGSPLVSIGAGPVRGLDVDAFSTKASNTSILRYTSPAFSGVRVFAGILDTNAVASTDNAITNLSDTTVVADTKAVTKPAKQFGLTYAGGPLTVAADISQFSTEANANYKSRTRITAVYNAGVAVVGLGHQTFDNRTTAVEPKTTTFGVSVPLNQITLGLQRINTTGSGATAGKKAEGTAIGVKYALSKRTDITLFNVSTKEGTDAAKKNTRVRLLHSF